MILAVFADDFFRPPSQDEFYEGHFLPEGAWVIPNIWLIFFTFLYVPSAHAEGVGRCSMIQVSVPTPMSSTLTASIGVKQKTKELVFGFGRRICYFAENTLFSIIATVLATCEVLPGLHKTSGSDVLPEITYTSSSIRLASAFMVCKWYVEVLLPFAIRLRPRSTKAAALLAEAVLESENGAL